EVLAARHQSVMSDDDVLAEPTLRRMLDDAGWRLRAIDDDAVRPYCAIAVAVRR
ncbi:MAG: hypothetical protein QOE63_2110, partial [Acidimicrobiaceae bacterium]